jgi:hypothetical protein
MHPHSVEMLARRVPLGDGGQHPLGQRLVPEAGALPAGNNKFIILSFAFPTVSDVVFIEGLTGDLYLQERGDVEVYNTTFRTLIQMAASPEATRGIIAAMIVSYSLAAARSATRPKNGSRSSAASKRENSTTSVESTGQSAVLNDHVLRLASARRDYARPAHRGVAETRKKLTSALRACPVQRLRKAGTHVRPAKSAMAIPVRMGPHATGQVR